MKSDPTESGRIELIDVARGIALVAMTIYHFTWDLEFFGWIVQGTTLQSGWVWFARCIASSFIFLVGVSLVLAHHDGVRWRSFAKRLAMLALAAAAISVVTYFAVPGGFIFFGILHGIALFSLLGIFFVRLHWALPLAAGVLVLIVENTFSNDVFSQPIFWWVGLAPTDPPSNDYVPLFPWFAAALFGIAATKIALQQNWLAKLQNWKAPDMIDRPLGFIGRHSLLYYLVHQPILMAAIWCFTAVAGPPDATPSFMAMCERQCTVSNGKTYCTSYCGCVVDGFKSGSVFQPFLEGKATLENNETIRSVINQCSVESD
jgi:uncharacterized membrane protein